MKRGVVDVVVVGVVVVEGVVSLDTLTWWDGANPVVVVGVVVVEGVVSAEEDSTEEDEREEGVGNFFSSILLLQRLVLVEVPGNKCLSRVFCSSFFYCSSCVLKFLRSERGGVPFSCQNISSGKTIITIRPT